MDSVASGPVSKVDRDALRVHDHIRTMRCRERDGDRVSDIEVEGLVQVSSPAVS